MLVANPTPREKMLDDRARPYFLWDVDITIGEFEARLRDPDLEVRAYFVAKLMRQARPDDVFTFVGMGEIEALWPRLTRHLGQSLPFWTWVREMARRRRDVA